LLTYFLAHIALDDALNSSKLGTDIEEQERPSDHSWSIRVVDDLDTELSCSFSFRHLMKLTEKILSFHAEENLVSEFGLEAIIVKS